MTDAASNYLRDLGPLLLDLARAAKSEAETTGDPFERGRHFGLYPALNLVLQQADAFGLDRDEVGLAGVDPDQDLL